MGVTRALVGVERTRVRSTAALVKGTVAAEGVDLSLVRMTGRRRLHPCTPLRELTELLSIDWAFPTFSNQASAVHQAALARATVRSPHDYVQHRKSHVAPPWPVWHWGLVGREGSIAPQVNARKGGRPLASPAGAPKRSGNRTPAGHRTARHPCGYASFYQVLGLSRNYGGRTRART
jgi:hypothetical protein